MQISIPSFSFPRSAWERTFGSLHILWNLQNPLCQRKKRNSRSHQMITLLHHQRSGILSFSTFVEKQSILHQLMLFHMLGISQFNVALHPPGVYGRDGGKAKMLFGAHGLKNHTVSPVGCARACYVAHSTTTAAFP